MYIIGVFRRTALWGMLLVVLSAIALKSTEILYYLIILAGIYLAVSLLHLLICKLKHRGDSVGEIYLSALGYDLAAPFSKFGTFLAVLMKKWIIHDDSRFHSFIDGVQVVTGGLWSIAIFAVIAFCIVNIVR